MNRRNIIALALSTFTLFSSINIYAEEDRHTHPFDRQWLEAIAKQKAAQEFVPQDIDPDSPLSQLNYDDYKKIQFQRGASIWRREDRNFRVSPLHPGFLFKTPVKLNLVVAGVSRRILYTSEIFNYDKEQEAAQKTQASGYSGFSVTTPINKSDKWDEFMVFQGGSYFRAVGKNNWYGLSARGLAVNTAKPTGEEFPAFTEFWIERPAESSKSLVVHAILESPSLTGAYTFTATPGENTIIEIQSTLYPRKQIDAFGIGPLTSMFLFNDLNRAGYDDFRPAVHDSHGLYMLKGNGEKIWRPLANPRNLQVSVFEDDAIKGFGLFQRHRDFEDFEDIEAHYEARPSAWVEPLGEWGAGHVELVEIPTDAEIHDNIVAFWQPAKPMQPEQEYTFNYRVAWGEKIPVENHPGRIVSSASGKALGMDNTREFVIDYAADNIPDNLQVNATTNSGNIVDTLHKVIPKNGHYRVIVKFQPGDEDLAELRLSLSLNDKAWGETWLYRWTR